MEKIKTNYPGVMEGSEIIISFPVVEGVQTGSIITIYVGDESISGVMTPELQGAKEGHIGFKPTVPGFQEVVVVEKKKVSKTVAKTEKVHVKLPRPQNPKKFIEGDVDVAMTIPVEYETERIIAKGTLRVLRKAPLPPPYAVPAILMDGGEYANIIHNHPSVAPVRGDYKVLTGGDAYYCYPADFYLNFIIHYMNSLYDPLKEFSGHGPILSAEDKLRAIYYYMRDCDDLSYDFMAKMRSYANSAGVSETFVDYPGANERHAICFLVDNNRELWVYDPTWFGYKMRKASGYPPKSIVMFALRF